MFKEFYYPHKKSVLIKDAITEVVKMLEKVERMFSASFDYLFFGKEYSRDLFKEDVDINAGERIVRRLVFEHLTINPKQDLIPSLLLISIIGDVERIGDYAKHLWELRDYISEFKCEKNLDTIMHIKDEIIPLFGMTKDAFYKSDEEKGKKVMEKHREIKKNVDNSMKSIFLDKEILPVEAAILSNTLIYLRRISAHLSNIASSVANPFDKIRADDE